jgi:hypothetical protein
MTIYASIRTDLYNSDILIPATEIRTLKEKYLDPILWQVVSTFDNGEVLLERPSIAGGGLYNFQSIDLEFEII